MSRQKLRQINRARKAAAELRRAEVLKKMSEGLPVSDIAEEMGLSRRTIYNQLLKAQREAPAVTAEVRAEADQELRALKDFILQSEEMTDKEIADSVRGIWQDLARLHGANAESKSLVLHANVADGEKLVGYRRFVAETRMLDPAQLEQVYQFARSLPRERAIPATPPATSELWEEDEKQRTGGTDEAP